MKILRLFLVATLTVTFFACSEDSNNPADNNNQNADNTPRGTSYVPITKGSWWKYRSTANKVEQIYKQSIVRDSVLNGKTYAVVTNDLTSDISLNRLENNNIIMVLPPQMGSTFREETMMKDNPVVGDKWSFNATIAFYDYEYIYEVISTGGTRVVSGKTYQNVAKVLNTIMLDFGGNKMEYSRVNYYFARGVGMIELEYTTDRYVRLTEFSIAK